VLTFLPIVLQRDVESDGGRRSAHRPCIARFRSSHNNRSDLLQQHLSWLEAGVVGGMQGVAELFPVSSLGHSVLLPAVVGGSWAKHLDVNTAESPYLAFIVGLHVATAIALVIYFWRDWVRIVRGLGSSIRDREVKTVDQRLAWLLVIATIPVGLVGVVAEHAVRTTLAKPNPTAVFLIINGFVLIGAEALRRRRGAAETAYVDERVSGIESDQRVAKLPVWQATLIGSAQILALAPGISRSGVTMVGGMLRGLSREDAARFSFLLATPVILASVLSGVGAYLSVRFLTKYLANRSLRPFGFYCIAAGVASLIWLAVR
jgi:undecaprenyl-diphosphatase